MCHPDTDLAGSATAATPATEETFMIDVAGASMPVFQAAPSGSNLGNVIIIHDIYGANTFYHELARKLAMEGYSAFLPDLFVREGPLTESTSEKARARGARLSFPTAIEDLRRTFDIVEQRLPGKTGVVGFCMGGTLVMLLAAREPRMTAGAIYYGFPANPDPSEKRPWQPIAEAGNVTMPLLGFWGDQDHGVGMKNVDAYRDALRAAGKPHDFTIYPGLPHAFLTFDETSPNYQGSRDSWRQLLAFYADHLT